MSLTQATLTLPGIAGLVLTLAVAVDANVLIYERMRDEVRAGRAADERGRRRLPPGADHDHRRQRHHRDRGGDHVPLGAGPVKGFAWTLCIGVVTSVFTAVLVTQVLIGWWFRAFRPKTLPITEGTAARAGP